MTPLRQALSEADEALTGTLLARMQDVEAARATVRLKKAAQDLLAALDASATTGRETHDEAEADGSCWYGHKTRQSGCVSCRALPSPAPPEGPRQCSVCGHESHGHTFCLNLGGEDNCNCKGPRDAAPPQAPELFAAGWRSGYNDGFIHCCEMNEKQHPIKVPSVQDAWQRHNLPEPEVIPRPVSADGAPGGE